MKKNYTLSPAAMVLVQGSSKGTQPKYYENGYWYKTNQLGYEGVVEYLASIVLQCSNIDDFVSYEECTINGKNGCRSKDFLKEKESFLSFQRIYEQYTGGNLVDRIRRFSEVSERIDFVVDFIKDHTSLDTRDYLSKILTLDMLILNTDRHFNNLGIIINGVDGNCRPAPVFDNGNSLLSDWERFDEPVITDNLDKVTGQPFSASLEYQALAAGFGLQLDYIKLDGILETMPKSRALEVLKGQLGRYKHVIPQICQNESRKAE